MPKCPKCKKEIESLRHVQSGWSVYDCWLSNDEKRIDYQHDEFIQDCNVMEWSCPECGELLFLDEQKVYDFFAGKKVKPD